MKYRESEEMYLETILILKRQKSHLLSIDIANELGYSRPSVSRAVGLLVSKGYVTMAGDGELALTQAGLTRATEIYERHRVITSVLVKLGAGEELAEENACRIEHVICPELFEVLKKFADRDN